MLLSVIHAAVLAAYLAVGWLEQRMGAAYLPVALLFAAFGSQAILLWYLWRDLVRVLAVPRSFENIDVIAHWLLLWPTIAVVIGWKYALRRVMQFALAMGLFNLLVVGLLFASVHPISLGGVLSFGFL